MPNLSDYTANLKKDKNKLRQYLASAKVTSQMADNFTKLSQDAFDNNGTSLTIYTQLDEPTDKNGLWFKTGPVPKIKKVSRYTPFADKETWTIDTSYGAINTQMPLYRIIYKNYMYGFATNSCMRVSLDNPSIIEKLPTPKEALGGTINIVSGSYGQSSITGYGDDIYILCASTAHGNSTSPSVFNDILKYNIVNQTWSYVCSITSTVATSNTAQPSSMITVRDKIYLFGSSSRPTGYSCPDQASYWILDPKTNIIEGPYSSPQNRVGAGSPALYQDRYLYLWCTGYQDGGNSTFYSRPQNNVYRLDTEDNTWEQLKASPLQHCGMNVEPLVIGNKIYLFGMIDDNRYWGSIYSTGNVIAYVYDILSDTYTRLPNLPTAFQGKTIGYYNQDNNTIMLSGRTNYSGAVVQATLYLSLEIGDYEDNEVILDLGLMTEETHKVNLYHQNNLNTSKCNITFSKAILWDKETHQPKDVETYVGDGSEWIKI